jgi:choline dehydrogenase
MLGGCTGMNAMIYLRGAPADFLSWPTAWQYAQNTTAFHAIEKRYFPDQDLGIAELHPLSAQFLDAAMFTDEMCPDELHSWNHASNLSISEDRAFEASFGPIRYPRTQRHGRRLTAFDIFLKPWLNDKRLQIHSETLVEQISIEGEQAVGIQARNGQGTFSIRAYKGVILSAGTIHSPRLLMQSGIGPATQLKQHDIPVKRPVDAVGENLQDHLVFPIIHALPDQYSIEKQFSRESRLEYVQQRTGPLASNLAEAGAFLSLQGKAESDSMTGAQPAFASGPPDVQLHFTPNHYLEYPIRDDPAAAFSIGVTLLHPKSRGSIRLSGSEKSGIAIDPNYLHVASDRENTLSAIEIATQAAQSLPLAKFSLGELIPGKFRSSDVRMEAAIAAFSTTLFHPVGTCHMSDSTDSVVDPNLRVRGFENLYIADASVFPNLPSANPQAIVMMIGYRLADMLSHESLQIL